MAKAVPTSAIDTETLAHIPTSPTTGVVHDMSIYTMFVEADIVVQTVILLLLAASFWSWTIFIDKFQTFYILSKRMKKFEAIVWASDSLEKHYEHIKNTANNPMARVFVAGMYEWIRLRGHTNDKDPSQVSLQFGAPALSRDEYARRDDIKGRVWHAMQTVRNREMSALEHNLGFLATVGSSAPFIGLFGTVWGIMDAFQAIAQTQNSTLAVVAPGIAEALFATAVGLFAAIPAVIFYNKFTNQSAEVADQVDDFCDEFAATIARELEME